jgi:hypothetical protein
MLTIEKVAGLLKDLRTKTENGEIQWSPFMKKSNEKDVVGFSTTLKNGTTVFKIFHIFEDKSLSSLTLKATVYKNPDDEWESGTVRLASITSTPSLNDELLALETAVTLANRKIPNWAEQAIFGEN